MELLEPASQLQALNSALSQVKAREGQGCVALVYGEAGIGKTSLVEHFINEKKSWRVLKGAMEVVTLIAQGKSNREIAEARVVASFHDPLPVSSNR